MSKGAPGVRYAEIYRETSETRVQVVLDLDGGTRRDISTGVMFFDHMLSQMAFHAHLDLGINAEGDLAVDDHHTVEDVGIVLGQAISQALDQGIPIARYASCHTPMDDALVLVALDFSGRGSLFFDVPFGTDRLGGLAADSVREFFGALARHAGLTVHMTKMAGYNDHHVCEACFKGFGRALHAATTKSERHGSSSAKGTRD